MKIHDGESPRILNNKALKPVRKLQFVEAWGGEVLAEEVFPEDIGDRVTPVFEFAADVVDDRGDTTFPATRHVGGHQDTKWLRGGRRRRKHQTFQSPVRST